MNYFTIPYFYSHNLAKKYAQIHLKSFDLILNNASQDKLQCLLSKGHMVQLLRDLTSPRRLWFSSQHGNSLISVTISDAPIHTCASIAQHLYTGLGALMLHISPLIKIQSCFCQRALMSFLSHLKNDWERLADPLNDI